MRVVFAGLMFFGVAVPTINAVSDEQSRPEQPKSIPIRKLMWYAGGAEIEAINMFDQAQAIEAERKAAEEAARREAERIAIEQARIAAEQEAVRQAEATRQAAIRAQTPVPRPTSNVSGVCGGATNGADQFIARESGGNPNIYNTGGSGAYGCYQIMQSTWASSCSDIGQYGNATPAQQAACASRLPLSAWR